MDPQKRNQQRLIYTSLAVFVIIDILLVFALFHHSQSKTNSSSNLNKTTTSYDPNSGETTRTIEGENNSGVGPGTPIYLGTTALLNLGLTSDQLANFETAFSRYVSSASLNVQQVSISVNSIQTSTLNPNTNPINVMSFPVILDNKTKLTATLQYTGLSNLELFLKNSAGTQVYDSGVLDMSSGN